MPAGVASPTLPYRKIHCKVDYSAGNTVTMDMEPGAVMEYIDLVLAGTLTLPQANNTRAATLRGDEWAVIKEITLLGDGDRPIRYFYGPDLWWYQRMHYRNQSPLVTTQIGNAVANPAFRRTLRIPFCYPWSDSPFATALNTAGMDRLRMRIKWGSHLDINAAATGFSAAPYVQVRTSEWTGIPSDLPLASTGVWVDTQIIPGATNRWPVRPPAGPRYPLILMNIRNSDATAADNAGAVTAVAIEAGGNEIMRWDSFIDLNNENYNSGAISYHYERSLQYDGTTSIATAGTGGYITTPRQNVLENSTSWLVFDFSRGRLADAIDSRLWNNLSIKVDTNAACTIRTYADQFDGLTFGAS